MIIIMIITIIIIIIIMITMIVILTELLTLIITILVSRNKNHEQPIRNQSNVYTKLLRTYRTS